VTKSFTSAATIDSKTDTDDYTFQGYPGQTLSAVLKAAAVAKGAQPLLPAISLFKPDGTPAAEAVITTKGSTVTLAKLVMDQQGTWRIHVIGLEPGGLPDHPDPDPTVNTSSTGAYSISVKLGKVSPAPSLLPDSNNQYRFSIPAVGGATIGYALTFTGAAPTFNRFIDPAGAGVFGIATTTKVLTFQLPPERPIGNYILTFDAPSTPPTNVVFVPKLILPKPAKARKATLSKDEPFVVISPTDPGVHPSAGGQNTQISVTTTDRVLDPSDPNPAKVKLYIDHMPLTAVTYDPLTKKVRGTVPGGIPLGAHDVVVETSTGQVTVDAGGFECVDRPHADTIDPSVGTSEGNFPVVITGSGFRSGQVGLLIDGNLVAPQITAVTDTTITFIAPPRSASPVTFGVMDRETQLVGTLPLNSFEYVGTAAISRIVPSITTVLGGDLITVKGANFTNTDHVYVEKDGGGYEEMLGTFIDKNNHRFVAPVRAKGPHAVYVTDQFNQPSPPRTRTLTYFQYTNLTADSSVMPSGPDQWDGVTNAVGDYDGDGYDDLFISRVGGSTVATTSLTRVLHNDGAGHFTDVTASVMPPASAGEDWRADRIWVTDIDTDGRPDILIVTNDNTAITPTKSHVRILRNEPRGGTGPSATERVFNDRTVDLFPGARSSSPLYGGGSSVIDNWRGLDMWVGDVDKGPAGPPEIIITNKEVKEELDVGCGNYCASPYSGGYTYGFYWGGSRAFFWNKAANQGQGKYKFEHNFFPRKAGVRVPVIAPGGVTIPICNSNYGKTCRGKFTPFTGRRIAVGDLNADGKPDVAVLSDDLVQKNGVTISSLQVAINKFDSAAGSEVSDVTEILGTAIAGNLQADTIEIGQPGFPDGNSFGVMAITRTAYQGGSPLMRLIKFKPATLPNAFADFEEITSAALPPNGGYDNLQASKILFRDIDTDGDQDMILVCDAAPGGTGAAFRVLRNERVGLQVGVFRETLKGLITPLLTATEHLEGSALAIGDVNKDGALDFIITRATTSPTSVAPQTRILLTDMTKAP
jgi:hypothetical protein